MKKTLKYAFIALLFIAVIAVPLFGVRFYDVGYDKDSKEWFSKWTTLVPSLFDENSILTNMQFGGGSAVYMQFDTDDQEINTEENYKKAAKALESRFQDRGFTDAKATVEDGMIRLDFAQKTYINSVMQDFGAIGEWSFVGSDMTKVLCDETYVEDAYVSANPQGGYAVTMKFTKSGAEEFFANTASYAVSGSYFYMMMDGQMSAYATVSDSSVRDTFSFGQYEYESASALASFIKSGSLPEAVKVVKVVEVEPTLGKVVLTVITVLVAAIILACVVAFFIFGRKAGVFAALALLADICIFLIALLSSSYQLNFITLITMVVFLVLGALLYVSALKPIGKSLKEKSFVSTASVAALNKFNIKALWIHAVLLIVSLICFLFVKGNIMYVVRIAMLFSAANIAVYYLFFYFGIRTLAEIKE